LKDAIAPLKVVAEIFRAQRQARAMMMICHFAIVYDGSAWNQYDYSLSQASIRNHNNRSIE